MSRCFNVFCSHLLDLWDLRDDCETNVSSSLKSVRIYRIQAGRLPRMIEEASQGEGTTPQRRQNAGGGGKVVVVDGREDG